MALTPDFTASSSYHAMSYKAAGSGADARIGSSIGPYRLESVLGTGGMSAVYGTRDAGGRRLALKLIREDFGHDERLRGRVRREIRIAQTIVNPHVVPVLDTGEHDGLQYLITPFMEGGSLADKLDRDGALGVATVLRICANLADGLESLWGAGVVHRDVKPANVLLDRRGVAYITDFGLAKDSQGTRLTVAGGALGSMDYTAPEQIRGDEVTPATDIYALGCVMFECLEGHPPFADREGLRVLTAHLQDEPPELTRAGLPPGLGEAVKVALRKDPSERPQTSREYARSLFGAAGIRMP
jgi:serine/threonine protein kinase